MAGTADVRDMMGLDRDGPRPKALKKKKHADPKPRATGMNREVQALMGDSVPPIALTEIPKYKSKPTIQSRMFQPRHWDQRPFEPRARPDGLTLRHWKRSIPGSNTSLPKPSGENGLTDVEMNDEGRIPQAPRELQYEEEFPSEKWNVQVAVPTYTDEQYDMLLKADNWTKKETDYLMDLCRNFDLRWIIIADRYVPEEILEEVIPSATIDGSSAMDVDAVEPVKESFYPERSMEALKARYYFIAAKMLEHETPPTNMTQAEYQLWEKMKNFDAQTETLRKTLAMKLFERTKDEAEEEKILLEELHRITKNEDDFLKMRRDLYSRLEPPPTKRNNGEEQSTAIYQTSSGLSVLLQTLLAKEKRLKRPMTNGDGPHGSGSMTHGDLDSRRDKWEKGRHPNQYTRRDTIDTQDDGPGPQKKGSQSQSNVRILTPPEELKFGVSHPQERLTSGIQFRHEKIHKIVQAKSQVQTTKIQQALVELGIPTRLVMPTERVCREFERLVAEIQILIDSRKVYERLSSEVKVLEEARRTRLGIPKAGEEKGAAAAELMDVDDSNVKPEEEDGTESKAAKASRPDNDEEEEEEEEEDAEGEEEDGREEVRDAEEEDDEDEGANEDSTMLVDEQDDDENDEAEEEDENDGDVEDRASVEEDDGEEEEEDDDVGPSFAEPEDEDDEEGLQEDAEDEEDEEEGLEEVKDSDEDGVDGDQSEENQDNEDGDEELASGAEDSDAPSEQTRPSSAQSAVARLHKRSASVTSEASKAGSNRSGVSRKKRR